MRGWLRPPCAAHRPILTPNHGTTLHFAAHSMGGLVSRWFIEREGGNQVVERLVMLGTPNGGSPWSTLQDWATTALTIGLNAGWLGGGWPVAWLGALAAAIERIDVTLDQLAPGSEFLRELSNSPDPGIPYWLVAGNTSLIAGPSAATDAGWWERLWSRLSFQRALHAVTAQAFLSHPNDMAVSVDSMQQVPSHRASVLQVRETACDHLSYFTDETGRGILLEILNTSREPAQDSTGAGPIQR